MTRDMVFEHVSDVVIQRPIVGDGLVLRGSGEEMSALTFPIASSMSSKVIRYQDSVDMSLPLRIRYKYEPIADRKVNLALQDQPRLREALESLVLLVITYTDAKTGQILMRTGTGVLLSPSCIFTAGHLLKDGLDWIQNETIKVFREVDSVVDVGVFDLSKGLPAHRAEFPEEIAALIDDVIYTGADGSVWERAYLDFVVVSLDSPINVSMGNLLEIPAEPEHAPLDVLCALGYPGKPVDDNEIDSVMPLQLLDAVKKAGLSNKEKQLFFRQTYYASMHHFRSFVASFGVVRTLVEPKESPYEHTTCSATGGFSGGPVVMLGRPKSLVGLVVGGRLHYPYSVMLDVHCPAVWMAYAHFVLNSRN